MHSEGLADENDYFDEFRVLDFNEKVNDENLSDLSKAKLQSD